MNTDNCSGINSAAQAIMAPTLRANINSAAQAIMAPTLLEQLEQFTARLDEATTRIAQLHTLIAEERAASDQLIGVWQHEIDGLSRLIKLVETVTAPTPVIPAPAYATHRRFNAALTVDDRKAKLPTSGVGFDMMTVALTMSGEITMARLKAHTHGWNDQTINSVLSTMALAGVLRRVRMGTYVIA